MAEKQAVVVAKEREMEFIPFGAKDKIKLSCEIVRRYIAVPTKEGDLPDDRDCTRFMMLCRSRQLNPFEGDGWLVGFRNRDKGTVDWSLITAHQAFLKRAEPHPEFNGKRSGIIYEPATECRVCGGSGETETKTGDIKVCIRCSGRGETDELEGDFMPSEIKGEKVRLVGGWCRVYFKTRSHPEYQRLKLSTYAKPTKNWTADPAGMICKCAEAAALRSAFPTSLGGMYLQEEQHAFQPEVTSSRPIFGQLAPKEAPQLPPGTPPAPQAQPQASPEPQKVEIPPTKAKAPAKPKEEPKPAPLTPLAKLRKLCEDGSVNETLVLEFLKEIGSAEPADESLDKIPEDVLEMVADQWDDIVEKLKTAS
jgi:phage recombination protein Bet